MKILHVLDHSLPLHSGYTFRSRSLFLAQQDKGWEPVVLTSSKHEESWTGPHKAKEHIDGIDYYRVGAVEPFGFPLFNEKRIMNRTYEAILRVAEAEKPDIIHAHSPVLNAFPAIRAAEKLGLPVVYEIRAFWEDAAVDHGSYAEGSWKYRLTRALETRACRKADHVFILCEGLKNDLISRGIPAAKIDVIYNGINPDDFAPCPPDEEYMSEWGVGGKTVIGFIGSFYRYEGLDLLVQSFADIAENRPDILLLLVGGGEVEDELKGQVSALGLQSQVIMPGRVPHERVAGVYAMVDILAYPRYRMRLTDLVTPLKPLEAMAMGKALVASDVGGNKELIRHEETGLLFAAGSKDGLTAALRALLDDADLQDKIRNTGKDWVREHHTWKKTTTPYVKVYKEVSAK
jgi:PEP-CTERM/exosortase A-associated glycosyltransferase